MNLLNSCPICKMDLIEPYSMKWQLNFPHISRSKCKSCGIVFANPVASYQELQHFYTNYYDKGNFGALNYKLRIKENIKEISELNIQTITSKKEDILQYKNEGRFLDVGFGLGEDLFTFHFLGFDVYGTEYDADCIEFIKPYIPSATLFNGDLLAANYPDEYFDVVNIYHVIEHLIDPVSYLLELKRILKPDGLLIIGTPNINAPAYQLYRFLNFASFQVPKIVDGLEHTVIFNKKNLGNLLVQNNFQILSHKSESLQDSLTNIFTSNLNFKKKIFRLAQTFVSVNQILIVKKIG